MRERTNLQASQPRLLKKDLFGANYLVTDDGETFVRRDTAKAAFAVRWLARRLLAREGRALARLCGVNGTPELRYINHSCLERSYLPGEPMHVGQPRNARYYSQAQALLRKLHRAGVAHNDLAKEPNLLMLANGAPAFIDFQLASTVTKRSKLFRILAREDIRHLLKHKRTYCSASLTAREKMILQTPSPLSRIFMVTIKPVYLFITRTLLGWRDREGAGDRF